MDGRLLYRHYIERALKNKGLRKMLRYVLYNSLLCKNKIKFHKHKISFKYRWIVIIHRVSMLRAKDALLKPDHYKGSNCSSSPNLYDIEYREDSESLRGGRTNEAHLAELRRYGAWSPEFQSLKLPQYRTLYLFLCRMPMDVIRESLCIRLEQKPNEPSVLSIRQLMQEFKVRAKIV